MSDTSSRVPADFDGIFFGEESGAGFLFQAGGAFIDYAVQRPDGLFMAVAAHIDIRLYDKLPQLAEELLERAKLAWTDANWTEIGQVLKSVDVLSADKPHGWRQAIFEIVKDATMPPAFQMPETFVAYFWNKELYEALFLMRSATFNLLRNQNVDLCGAVLMLIGLYLNDAKELLNELETALPHFWEGVDLPKIREYYELVAKARATGSPTWEDSVQGAIELSFRGYSAVGDALIIDARRQVERIHTPVDFEPIFMTPEAGEAMFANREQAIDLFTGRPEAEFVLAAMVIDLRINNHGELADSLLARARELWTGFDFTKVDAVISQAAELASQRPDGWQEAIHQLAHAELEPRIPELPESYQNYFVPRRVLEFLYANGPVDGLGMMHASHTELYRVVKTMVVMNLNDDHAFVAALEATLPRFYPEADIERIRRLYTEVRDIKTSYGEHWFTFANAHIDLAIRGHADITWIEGAA